MTNELTTQQEAAIDATLAAPDASAVRAFPKERGYLVLTDPKMVEAAELVFKSGLAPRFKNAGQVLVAWQMGHELGFNPMESLQMVHVINGIASLDSQVAKALVRERQGLKEGTDFDEWVTGSQADGKDLVGHCRAHPSWASDPVEREFSYHDAVRARLWSKEGPWKTYPKRMLVARARGFLIRDVFTAFTIGLRVHEEVRDMEGSYPTARDVTPASEEPTHEQAPVDPLLAGVEGVEAVVDAEIVPAGDSLVQGDNGAAPEASNLCGVCDPEDDDVYCMQRPHRDGPHDWEIPVGEPGQLPLT